MKIRDILVFHFSVSRYLAAMMFKDQGQSWR